MKSVKYDLWCCNKFLSYSPTTDFRKFRFSITDILEIAFFFTILISPTFFKQNPQELLGLEFSPSNLNICWACFHQVGLQEYDYVAYLSVYMRWVLGVGNHQEDYPIGFMGLAYFPTF